MKIVAVVVLRAMLLGVCSGYQYLVSSQSVGYTFYAAYLDYHLEAPFSCTPELHRTLDHKAVFRGLANHLLITALRNGQN